MSELFPNPRDHRTSGEGGGRWPYTYGLRMSTVGMEARDQGRPSVFWFQANADRWAFKQVMEDTKVFTCQALQ